MEFLRKAILAVRRPSLALGYARWTIYNKARRPLLVDGAFGTRLQASAHREFRDTRGLVPRLAETEMIQKLSSNSPLFVDAGANVGAWTVALAAAHPNAHVYSFEPTPGTFRMLSNNIALNRLQNVTAMQVALSDSAGPVPFQISKSASIFNRLAPGAYHPEDYRHRFAGSRVIEVESISLDDFCRNSDIDKVGFLKLDVEGAEVRVLRGARNLLRNRAIELIWLEVEPDNLRETGDSINSLAEFMATVGYTLHFLQSDGYPGPAVDIRRDRTWDMVAKPA